MKISFRIWILIICLILSVLAIRPNLQDGVLVKSVDRGSAPAESGLKVGEIITAVNGVAVSSVSDYSSIVSQLFNDGTEKRLDITTQQNQYILLTNSTPEITVSDVPRTRIKTGLDIQGGARALVRPTEPISDSQLQDLIDISNNRFNVFGISDVKIRAIQDLSGEKYMLVEVAGATTSDLEELVAKQGKFEAKIGNNTVFVGGDKDITSVCRNDAKCAGIVGCSQSGAGYLCTFSFTIYLSEEAAKRHADITSQIPLDASRGNQYLAENLTLVVDDVVVDQLLISKDLRGRETAQISVQGSGSGTTQEDALNDAKASMHNLQTILITGSIPYKLEIVKLDTISPELGKDFTKAILWAGLAAILAVSITILIRYRKIKLSLALLLTSFSEIVIILGVAALIGWNLDLASIAGILATIGTGVDQQIVILDEARRGRDISIRERMKRALFIIFSAYLTALASLLPLYWAGAGLFKGFAITSIIGITAGVFITRPAFADMIKKIEDHG